MCVIDLLLVIIGALPVLPDVLSTSGLSDWTSTAILGMRASYIDFNLANASINSIKASLSSMNAQFWVSVLVPYGAFVACESLLRTPGEREVSAG